MIHRLYAHLVWTTRNREPVIDARLARFLCGFLRGVARQRLKGGSAAVAGKERHSTRGHVLRWAKGYAIHSVSPRVIGNVRDYLRAQPTRHRGEAIPDWQGDIAEYDVSAQDEWRSEQRMRGMRG